MKVLLGVTGSVAATLTPKIVEAIRREDHEVKVVITKVGLHFYEPVSYPQGFYTDRTEFPSSLYEKGNRIFHIELRDWADVFVIAPLSANTLAKIANGMCDNLLTCVFRSWDPKKPIILAPAMNTKMWESPFTVRHLNTLRDLPGYTIKVVDPVRKVLACGEDGVGALAPISEIIKLITT